MSVRSFRRRPSANGLNAALAVAVAVTGSPVQAGHEVSYYPSFYPQEVRIEPLQPPVAARELAENRLHVHIGAAPTFEAGAPAHLKSVASLGTFVVAEVNPRSSRVQGRDARCRAIRNAGAMIAGRPGVVTHPYPITPYHADYLVHADRVQEPGQAANATDSEDQRLRVRPDAQTPPPDWDIAIDEVPVGDLLRSAGIGFNAWPTPPWTKEGWFQAYHLLRPRFGDPAQRSHADAIYERLTHGAAGTGAEKLNLQRDLVAALIHDCDRAVVGYRVRHEAYNDDFSNGIENIAADSQFGFNSPIFVRAVKLKDFPWNGWLRVGIDSAATAAWNPIAGFNDAAGRLVWATIGDNAYLPIPYNSGWASNRADVGADDRTKPSQSVLVPADAIIPAAGSGRIGPVGPGKGATAKLTYQVLASQFHDGTDMEPADLLYPYALAQRWGTGGTPYDPEIAAATRLVRERLRGVRLVRTETKTLQIADQTFTYRFPVVEVYLNSMTDDDREAAVMAPPWSSVPWHLLALMEAAVERGVAAFSQGEAARRGVPWLDLVRDPVQRQKMTALIEEFAKTGYRPPALEGFVDPETASERWRALAKFAQTSSHLLVTNGGYRLKSWSPEAYVFDVVREFTYPIGLGTFDFYAYPATSAISGIERTGDRVLVAVDAEVAVKQQRERRMVRTPLKRDTLRGTFAITPEPRFVILGVDGRVATTGGAARQPDGRFAVTLPKLAPGDYDLRLAVFLDGNTVSPAIGRIGLRSD